jgi:uncharacterized protein YijF (DUF1287 family)
MSRMAITSKKQSASKAPLVVHSNIGNGIRETIPAIVQPPPVQPVEHFI